MKTQDILNILLVIAIGYIIFENFLKKNVISNEETWEVCRDKDGCIKNIVVHRKVHQDKWQKKPLRQK